MKRARRRSFFSSLSATESMIEAESGNQPRLSSRERCGSSLDAEWDQVLEQPIPSPKKLRTAWQRQDALSSTACPPAGSVNPSCVQGAPVVSGVPGAVAHFSAGLLQSPIDVDALENDADNPGMDNEIQRLDSPIDVDGLENDIGTPVTNDGVLREVAQEVDITGDNFFELCRQISMGPPKSSTEHGEKSESFCVAGDHDSLNKGKDVDDGETPSRPEPPSQPGQDLKRPTRDVVQWPGPLKGESMFEGITMMIVHNTKQQYDIWSKKAQDYGAIMVRELTNNVHIVVSDYSYRLIAKKAGCEVPNNTRVLNTQWIIRCLKDKSLAPYAEYDTLVYEKMNTSTQKPNDSRGRDLSDSLKGSHSSSHRSEALPGSSTGPTTSNQMERESTQGSDGNGFDDVVERDVFYNDTLALKRIVAKQQHISEQDAQKLLEKRKKAFACTKEVGPREGVVGCINQGIVDMLQECSNQRKIDKDPKQRIKQVMYTKCISQIKQLSYKITLANVDNLIKVKNIGEAAIRKMKEYLLSEDGSIRRIRDPPEYVKITQEFQTIWGVGPTMAGDLYSRGFRTIDDIRKKKESVLNSQQLIGLKHIADFNEKIPRSEVASIEEFVSVEAKKLFGEDTTVAITGSYRRGKDKSGDCDVLITRPHGVSVENVVRELVERLSSLGFITDRLTSVKEDAVGKFMGVCRISEKYRRIDLLAVPNHHFAFALLYFTGSGHFNRSMRLWCKKHGLHLSGTELTRVERNRFGDIVRTLESYQCFTEREIFEACGLPYVAPNQRNI